MKEKLLEVLLQQNSPEGHRLCDKDKAEILNTYLTTENYNFIDFDDNIKFLEAVRAFNELALVDILFSFYRNIILSIDFESHLEQITDIFIASVPYPNTLKFLLEAGVNVNTDESLIVSAAMHPSPEILKLLIKAKAKADVQRDLDDSLEQVMNYSSFSNELDKYKEVTDILVKAGAIYRDGDSDSACSSSPEAFASSVVIEVLPDSDASALNGDAVDLSHV